MSDKLPQPTDALVHRLQRVAKWLNTEAERLKDASIAARANTCWQAAARLEQYDAPRAGYKDFTKAVKDAVEGMRDRE